MHGMTIAALPAYRRIACRNTSYKEHRQDTCTKCHGENKNKAILGMLIVKGAQYTEGVWKGAQILNAKNGKWYGCQISLSTKDRLKVRGFIGHPWFGKNFYWDRVE